MLTGGLKIRGFHLGKRDTDAKIAADRSADQRRVSKQKCGCTRRGGDGTHRRRETAMREERRGEETRGGGC